MQTFDQSIFSLFQHGLVTLEEALRWASNVDEFKLKVQGISTTSDMARDEMAKRPGFEAAAVHRKSPGSVDNGTSSAHTEGLKLLARRELSVEGVRARLRDRGFPEEEIAALEQLIERGALDDCRVARAYAQTAATVKGAGGFA